MDNMRVHMARREVLLNRTPYEQRHEMKPHGLWYAFGGAWLKWVKGEMPEWEGNYLYEVKVNSSNILRISSVEDIQKFSDQYAINLVPLLKEFPKYRVSYIDWPSVAQKYDGIEITPYLYQARFEYLWYYGWDVASGCIWNLDQVKMMPLDDKLKELIAGERE